MTWNSEWGPATALRRTAALVTGMAAVAQGQPVEFVLPWWPADQREAWAAHEKALLAVPNAEKLLAWHELLASEPHVAGTPGDAREIDRLVAAFTEMGLEVERHPIWPLLARPVSCAVEVVSPERVSLVVKEQDLVEDRFSTHPDQMVGWNAFSGSGDVIAGVVYANYGAKADFEKLKELGVAVEGKIVVARYGGNYRGFKAKFAQDAGAAGVIIYTDPADSGYVKGIVYPEGGYANDTCIERGSILTLPQPGDPLTPFVEATQDAVRLDPESIGLPKIPVQPVGWGTAQEIMKRMKGDAVPQGWQGGLPMTYRVTGGDELKVRLKVEQTREIIPTFNVIATLRGETEPERMVLIGCHHDAWSCGASDATCGMIALLETARALTDAAKQGKRPARSVVFCAWGAEEFGIIGSTEWVEKMRDDLFERGVAYINLDAASMGPDFGVGTAPSLRRLVSEAARAVPQPRDATKTVFQAWLARGEDALFPGLPRFGELGGGSDHVGFWCHVAVPSTSLSGGGAKGSAYHSTYDTLPWYWKAVGSDYEPALMVARMTTSVASRLAGAPLLPIDPVRYGLDTRRHLIDLTTRGAELGVFEKSERDVTLDLARLDGVVQAYDHRARRVHGRLLEAVAGGALAKDRLDAVNAMLMTTDRAWFAVEGLPDRPWFRNTYVAPDADSGYASEALPLLRRAIESKSPRAVAEAEERVLEVFRRLDGMLDAIEHVLDEKP
ncbi:MAG: M20/M25/M40 family metallo-hydrolase [Phycisphaerales bacterium]